MRNISSFVITKTTDRFPDISPISFSRGLIYPYPHIYIFNTEKGEDYNYVKMRPLNERCATVRDSIQNNSGVGIVLYKGDSTPIDEKMKTLAATLIRFIIDDLGIEKYTLVSDETDAEKFIDVFDIDAKIQTLPSSFTKRQI